MNRELLGRVVEGAKRVPNLLLSNVNKGLLDRVVERVKGVFSLSMLKRLLLYTACFLALYAVVGVGGYLILNDNLPDIDAWSFRPKRVTNVYSADGRHLQDFLEENREMVTYEEIPASMRAAPSSRLKTDDSSRIGASTSTASPDRCWLTSRTGVSSVKGPARSPSSSPAISLPRSASSAAALPLRMWRPRTRARSANRSPPS